MSKTFDIINLPEDALPAIDTLSGDMRLVAEIVGVRAALLLAQRFDGTPIRIWGYRRWLQNYRDRCMRAEYDRGGIAGVDLFRKYGVSESWGWKILGRTTDDRQMSLF